MKTVKVKVTTRATNGNGCVCAHTSRGMRMRLAAKAKWKWDAHAHAHAHAYAHACIHKCRYRYNRSHGCVLSQCNRRKDTKLHANTPWDPTKLAMGYAAKKAVEVVNSVQTKRKKPEYNGTFLLVFINLAMFCIGNLGYNIDGLMLSHMKPVWYQFITSIFCHQSWQHLSSNLFLLYIFGKLVEEEEGAFGVWMTYLVCGIGGSVASLFFTTKYAVSLGASGAVFGLFVVSVLVRLSFNFKKLIESAIVGQFVYEQLKNEIRMQSGKLGMKKLAAGSVQVSHVAHLAGALAGVILILLLSRLPAVSSKKD